LKALRRLTEQSRLCYLLFMYAKPERGDVTASEIEALLAELDES
jgi:hypothetical protein